MCEWRSWIQVPNALEHFRTWFYWLKFSCFGICASIMSKSTSWFYFVCFYNWEGVLGHLNMDRYLYAVPVPGFICSSQQSGELLLGTVLKQRCGVVESQTLSRMAARRSGGRVAPGTRHRRAQLGSSREAEQVGRRRNKHAYGQVQVAATRVHNMTKGKEPVSCLYTDIWLLI